MSTATDGYFFLSKEAREALPNYSYSGEDQSYLYRFVLSPLASYLVSNWTPRNLAPNTITLSGLVLMVIAYITTWYYVPSLSVKDYPSLPWWIFVLHSIAMLGYQTLDNMDGKQARRTGSSSPLGMLFDHGCDAINTMFGSSGWIIFLGLDPSTDPLWCWSLIFLTMGMFFLPTWEEYYTGEMFLPVINGPNEGVLGGALISLTTCVWGFPFWQSNSWYQSLMEPFLPGFLADRIPMVRNADVQIMVGTFCMVREICSRSFHVASRFGVATLWRQVPYWVVALSVLYIGAVDMSMWLRMPRTSIHLFSGLLVEMVTQLMLDHITKQKYNPLRWVLLPLVVLTVLFSLGQAKPSSHTDTFLLIYTSSVWTILFLKIRIVVHEVCCVLNIRCFDISSMSQARDTKKDQ